MNRRGLLAAFGKLTTISLDEFTRRIVEPGMRAFANVYRADMLSRVDG